jgi:hypothetical protein
LQGVFQLTVNCHSCILNTELTIVVIGLYFES